MRLNVRREQIDVMSAVAEAHFEQRIGEHLRQNYADAVVKLPNGGEFTVAALEAETLRRLVRAGINRARKYELTFESAIAAFVALMFHVCPNFDQHRLCQVLLADEEKEPNERVAEISNVLSERNWDSVRETYDPEAWNEPAEPIAETAAEPGEAAQPDGETVAVPSPNQAGAEHAPISRPVDPMEETIPNKTPTRATRRRGNTLLSRPLVPEAPPIDLDTIVNIDIKEK
jgi:hypothetical protein